MTGEMELSIIGSVNEPLVIYRKSKIPKRFNYETFKVYGKHISLLCLTACR